MDKALTKAICVSLDIPTPRSQLHRLPDGRITDQLHKAITAEFKPPYIVKPNDSGSTVGLTKVDELDPLTPALIEALGESTNILVEDYIAGREMTVSVLDGRPLAGSRDQAEERPLRLRGQIHRGRFGIRLSGAGRRSSGRSYAGCRQPALCDDWCGRPGPRRLPPQRQKRVLLSRAQHAARDDRALTRTDGGQRGRDQLRGVGREDPSLRPAEGAPLVWTCRSSHREPSSSISVRH